jgi:hypothetical protein
VITIGVLRFNSNDNDLSPEISITSVELPHLVKRELQDNLFKGSELQLSKKKTLVVATKPFSFRRVTEEQNSFRRVTEEQTDIKKSTPITEQEKPDVLVSKEMSSNSRNLLINADIINYSLKDPRKALSRYDMIVNYYPNTDAAQEAKERIKSILDSEFSSQSESSNVENTANAGM